jgi:hypothetical protein
MNWSEVKTAVASKLELDTSSCKLKYEVMTRQVTITGDKTIFLEIKQFLEQDWQRFFESSNNYTTLFVFGDTSKPLQKSPSKGNSQLKWQNIKVDQSRSMGSGDFGVVYFGEHLATQVAIKVLKSHDSITTQNMKQELELLRFTTTQNFNTITLVFFLHIPIS